MKNEKQYVWMLDPGHGIDTPGKCSPEWPDGSQQYEWFFNRRVVQYLIEMLTEASYTSYLIVKEEMDISLKERVSRANDFARLYPDRQCVYLSLHGNMGLESAHGIEVFTSPVSPPSDKFAGILLEELAHLGWSMRYDTYRNGNLDNDEGLYVLQHTMMPAVLSKNGFYTNRAECEKMMNPYWIKRIARAHFDAIHRAEQEHNI